MNYNEHNQTSEFLDSLAFNSFISLILQPTKITSHSNTLINNMLSNVIDPEIMSGNLNATISDHLPQFSINSNMLGNISGNKSKRLVQTWLKKFYSRLFGWVGGFVNNWWAKCWQLNQKVFK